MPLPRAGQPFDPAAGQSGRIPRVAQNLVVAGLDVAGTATIGLLRVLNRISGNVVFDGYLVVKDGNGVTRVEMGNLPANGISPAQFGLRVDDQNNTPIFDSLGLINVMSVLGSFTDNNADSITSTTPVVLDSVSVTFNLSRPANVLAWFMSTAQAKTSTTGFFASARIFFDGTAHGPTGFWDKANGYTNASISHFINLAAGSHTVDFRVSVDSGITWTNFQTTLNVFLLGT